MSGKKCCRLLQLIFMKEILAWQDLLAVDPWTVDFKNLSFKVRPEKGKLAAG